METVGCNALVVPVTVLTRKAQLVIHHVIAVTVTLKCLEVFGVS